jgi:hypothetical protein
MKFIFCIPGKSFSNRFLQCWTETLEQMYKAGHEVYCSFQYLPNVYHVRNLCLGADVTRGIRQKPFNGWIQYDYIIWVDSDILWSYSQIIQLVGHEKPICSGLYLMEGGKQFATVVDWNEEYFLKNGGFKFLEPANIQGRQDLIKVDYTGFGFMAVKYGVFEAMEYPWFRPLWSVIGSSSDFSSEDVGFCLSAKKEGFEVFIDPMIVVGHEKTFILKI